MEMMITISIIILILAIFIVGANTLTIRYQKQKIRGSAEKKGWKIINISYRFSLGDNAFGYQKYDVDFVNEKGFTQNGTCKLRGLFSGVDWSA